MDAISPEDLDKTLKDGLGLRWSFMGPFETIDLNAPLGVRDYIERYSPSIYELAQEQTEPVKWEGKAVEVIEKSRRSVLPLEKLAERSQWRDRRLMELVAHKKNMTINESKK